MTSLPKRNEYSTAVEGGAPVRVRYAISGRLDVSSYLDFVAERAGWLGISGWVAANDDNSVTLLAAGPEAMVGALEMACTLGPDNALVEDIIATDAPGPAVTGFEVRR
jgi:acylphosphatase